MPHGAFRIHSSFQLIFLSRFTIYVQVYLRET